MKRCSACLEIAGVALIVLVSALPAVFCAETFSDKGYSAVVLERRNAIQGRSVDALVLTAAGGRYRFIRRLDENYRLVLNATSGTQATAVTAENSFVYDAMIKENQLTPRTLRDNNGREIGVVYCGLNPCYIDRRIRQDGTMLLEVKGRFFADPEIPGVFDRRMLKD